MSLAKVQVTIAGIRHVGVIETRQARGVVAGIQGPGGGGNATHTGEVTGSAALTVDPTAISNKTSKGTLTGAEELLINDGGTLKKTTAANLAGATLVSNPLTALSASAI